MRLDVATAVVLDPTTRYELVCVLREALANVERHAAAGRVTVGLRDVDGGVELSVSDDGHGFAPPADPAGLQSAGHFGVVGMGERARRVGGVLVLRSRPGQGTTVRVTVPATAAVLVGGGAS